MRDVSEFRPLHMSMSGHRKTKRLMRLLDLNLYEAMGVVTAMWCEVLDTEPDGVLDGWTDEDVANAIEWDDVKANANALVDSLVKAGWLDRRDDGVLVVHESVEYQGVVKKAHEREQARLRQADSRERRRAEEAAADAAASSVTKRDSHGGERDIARQARDFSPSPSPSQSPSCSKGGAGGKPSTPNRSETERPEASLEGIREGLADDVDAYDATGHNGPAIIVWKDHARALRQERARFDRQREPTREALKNGLKLSELLKGSLVVRGIPYWRDKPGGFRAADSWTHVLGHAGEMAQAFDELGADEAGRLFDRSRTSTTTTGESTGPPKREAFETLEQWQLAVDEYMAGVGQGRSR